MGARGSGSFSGLIDYIRRDSAALRDKNGNVVDIRHNVFGSPEEIVRQFLENENARIHRRANNVALHHIVLSLSGKDKVTPEMLEDITRKYISLMNQDALYYSTLHMGDGTDNPHSHTLMSGVAAGLSVRQSKEDFRKTKIEIENFVREQYPELTFSQVDHGRLDRSMSDKEWQIGHDGRISRHEQIQRQASVSFELATSREEFYDLLRQDSMNTYVRNGEVVGIEDGYNFRFESLNLDLDALDERERRMSELDAIEQAEEPVRQVEDQPTVEEMRLQELEGLEKTDEEPMT